MRERPPGQRGDADGDHRAGNQPARQVGPQKQQAAGGADDERLERAENFGAVGKAEDIEAGIRLTPPYGKSGMRATNAPRDCSNAPRRRRCPAGVIKFGKVPDRAPHAGGLSGYFALSAAVFLHSERNFLRSLP